MKKGDMEWSTLDEMWDQVKSRYPTRAAVLVYVDDHDGNRICAKSHGWDTEILGLLDVAKTMVMEHVTGCANDGDEDDE